jgi:hypothetical protein
VGPAWQYSSPVSQWTREWLVIEDGGERRVPGFEFLMGLPPNVCQTLLAITDAVRTTGPDRWRDPNTHKAMRGDLDRVHETRDKHGETLYRLFLRWQRDEQRVVVIDGRVKPNNAAISATEYAKIEQLADLADQGPENFAVADDFAAMMLTDPS